MVRAHAPSTLKQTPPKFVAVDLDNTVVDYHYGVATKPTKRVIKALRAVREAGVPVAVVTGRAVWGAERTADDLELIEGFASASHGASEYDLGDRRITYQATVDPGPAIDAFRAADSTVEFAVARDLDGWYHTSGFATDFHGKFAGPIGLDEAAERPVPRLIARVASDNGRDPGTQDPKALRLAAAAALDPADYHVEVGFNGWIDIGPPGVTKATGVARIARHYGVSSADTVVFGDAHNDLTMFEWAGYSVAMGQAVPRVRAAADEVAPSVWEDGVAEVLERWF